MLPFHSDVRRVAAAVAALALIAGGPAMAAESTATLSLEEALRLTRAGHPALEAAGLTVDAARARARDAGRWPNPSLAAGVENFGGSLGSDRAETSLLIEQPIELGGDRAARAGAARAMTELSLAQRAQVVRTLEGETTERFCDAWALQERVIRLREAEEVAARAVAAAEERLKAGAGPAFERTRALGLRALREVERGMAEADLASARDRLALMWGADSAAFGALDLPEPSRIELPALDELVTRVDDHPGVRAAAAEHAAERWRVREARAARVPDLQIGTGVRHLADAGGTGLVVGLALPLPLWNRQSGRVAAAESQLAATDARRRQTALEARVDLEGAHRRTHAAIAAWEGIRDRVRPAAEEAMRLITAGYRAGRLGYLEIQEGQRSLLEADLMLIERAAEVWRARSALERLMSAPPGTAPAKEDR